MALQLGVLMLFAVVAVAVFLVGDRFRPVSWQREDDEGAHGMVLDMVNMFFAAIVAFVVVILWQQYDNATAHTVAEGKALVVAYETAGDLPDSDRSRVQGLVREYTEQVVTVEWVAMRDRKSLSGGTQETFDELRAAVAAVRSADPAVLDARQTIGESLDAVAEARYDRALDAGYSLPVFLYIALWFGTVMLLAGGVFSGVMVTKRSVVMTAMFGFVVGAIVLTIYKLDRPFAGWNVVSREAYELALARFQQIASAESASNALPR
ncbi:bestrophin-like domain [Nocardia sp. IFM 10818]